MPTRGASPPWAPLGAGEKNIPFFPHQYFSGGPRHGAGLARADHVEEIGLPSEGARRDIIADTLQAIATVWKDVGAVESGGGRASEGRSRPGWAAYPQSDFAAAASDMQTAKDPNKLTRAQIERVFHDVLATLKEMAS